MIGTLIGGSFVVLGSAALGWHFCTSTWDVIRLPSQSGWMRGIMVLNFLMIMALVMGMMAIGIYSITCEFTLGPKIDRLNNQGVTVIVTNIDHYLTSRNGYQERSIWAVKFRFSAPSGPVEHIFSGDSLTVASLAVGDSARLYNGLRPWIDQKRHPPRIMHGGQEMKIDLAAVGYPKK